MDNEEIIIKITRLEEETSSLKHRMNDAEALMKKIEDVTNSLYSLTQSVEIIAKEQVKFREDQEKLNKRVTEVEIAPHKAKAKRHDDVIQYIAHILIGAIIGYIIFAVTGFSI